MVAQSQRSSRRVPEPFYNQWRQDRMKNFFIAIAFLMLLSSEQGARACSCGGQPSPCEAYTGASAVFVGYVSKIEPESKDLNEAIYNEQTAWVQVERTFKGAKEAEIIFHQPGHNCAPKFKAGDRWLFYATYHKDTKTWEVYGCGRSSPVDQAHDDLLFLEGLPRSLTRARISGEISQYEQTPEKGFTRVRVMTGLKVKIIGEKKTYEIYTDANGVYEIYDLPRGKYAIEPEIPPGMKIRFPMPFGPVAFSENRTFKVESRARSCAGSDFVLCSDSRISGRVFGANGEVMPRVCLNLWPANKPADRYFRISDCTESDGSYEITEIPPGDYIVVVNDDGKMSGDEPFPTAYYPGVFEKEKAAVITISEGTKLDGYDIHIPSQSKTVLIQGVLLYSDGRPVSKEGISFKVEKENPSFEGSYTTLTDDQGRFTFKLLQGTVGLLKGEMDLYESKFSDCPHIRKLLLKKQENALMLQVETKPMRIEVDDDIKDIKLIFPFPLCPKREPNQK
jgi:hypothetical protein